MKNKVLIIILAAVMAVATMLYIVFDDQAVMGVVSEDELDAGEHVYINEVMCSNGGYIPSLQGEFYDWIEIYNPNDKEINLSQWALSDTRDQGKWTFPSSAIVGAKSYLIVYCSSLKESIEGELHASFRIKNGEESIYLFNASGRIVDTAPANIVPKGYAYGRIDGSEGFVSMLPSPSFSNSEPGRQEYLLSMKIENKTGVIISEIQPNNVSTLVDEDGNYPDWIEIYNSGTKQIDISGYGLSDEETRPLRWKFPENTKLLPGEYIIIYADGNIDTTADDNHDETNIFHTSFKLNNNTGGLYLSDSSGKTIDHVEYKDIGADFSYIFSGESWKQSSKSSPGYENTSEGMAKFEEQVSEKFDSDVYISEVMTTNSSQLNDEDFYDWIELYNSGESTVDIGGYGLGNNTDNPSKFSLPKGTKIKAGGYLVIRAVGVDESKKKSDLTNYIYAPFKLNNVVGDIIALWDDKNKMIDKMAVETLYEDSSAGRTIGSRETLIFPVPSPNKTNSKGYTRRAYVANIDIAGGIYSTKQMISAATKESDSLIKYTLDGSEPTPESKEMKESLEIKKTTVLRTRVFARDEKLLPSKVTTETYIVGTEHDPRLSIVSLATDSENLYDEDTGIYVKGKNAQEELPFLGANYWNEWERPAHVEIFSPNDCGGEQQLSQDIAIRIFGDYSRAKDQKGFSLIPRSMYGSKSFDFPVFENRPFESYRSLVLRAGAQDSTVTKIHDIVATGLVDGTTNLEVQAYRQSVLYVNGNYFGIYNIREKVSRFWIAQHYNLKSTENIDLLVGNGTALAGNRQEYDDLIKYCRTNDLKNPENYTYVTNRIDVENYIDYLIAEMYVANTDTGNIKYFRVNSGNSELSKWRWIYYDFCWSFIQTKMDSFEFLTDPNGHGAGRAYSTQLNRSLFQNEEFRSKFLRRAAELLNTIYTPENVLSKIEECENMLLAEMHRDIEKWPEEGRGGYKTWELNIKHMKFFAENRRDYMIGFLRKHFDLDESQAIAVFGDAGIIVEAIIEEPQAEESTAVN